MAEVWWYYTTDGQQLGPVSNTALREMAARGQLKPTDLVWHEGMSQWLPASATRGLFPTAVQEMPTASAASSDSTPRQRSRRPDHHDDEDLSDLRPGRLRSTMSPGGKVILIGGATLAAIAFVVIGGFTAALVVGGMEGRQQHSYSVKLNFKDERSSKFVHFNKDELVHISVITTEWGGGPPPDVDLYIYTPDGQKFDMDDGPEKDCDVRFVAPQTGLYKIELHLCDGNWAQCTVRH